MTSPVAERLLTAEEFWCLPDPEHGGKVELVAGRVVIHMPVGGEHSVVSGTLIVRFSLFVSPNDLGRVGPELGFLLRRAPDLVRAPDVYFVRADRLPGGRMPKSFFDGPPDLAVEVVSPGDLDDEVATKVHEYLAWHTPLVWVVRPSDQTVTVHRADMTARTFAPGETLTSAEAGFDVAGFELPVAAIFE